MKFNVLAVLIGAACLNATSALASPSLNDYIDQSISDNYRIKSLQAQHDLEKTRWDQEDQFYLPSFSIDHTTKTHMMDGQEQVGIRPFDNRAHESNVNLRSNIWRDNHQDVQKMLGSKADAAGMNVEIEKSNIRAQITTSAYNIYLYERLIAEGELILEKARVIDRDIRRKVKGGLAKASDQTNAEVLINDMESAILATKLKIKQLHLNLEQVSGVPYPKDMQLAPKDVHSLIYKTPSSGIESNKALVKKSLDVQAANQSIDAADNWMSVDLYAKTKADDLTFSRMDSEVGVMVTMNLFNPASYWKEKTSAYQHSSEKYMLDQMHADLALSLQSQLSILESNHRLLSTQIESISIKDELIKERQNEYQINQTSLYELIQAWNGYYTAIQMKTDTEATLVNTMLSIDVLTGEI
ncbi:TolC family protein [Vibrio coralliirubri]|uniref:TolC family protein n=1 Tax=Vibrio coralliirubri TaxID=1516159 RepID=UPI00228341DA|nr:TolC family protein [Vibrio coralliirubri]MCY9861138.1 TolC family protein [Vibrio coralliirubri]